MAELDIRYANAIFDLAIEKNVLDEYMEQAVFLCEVLKDHEFLRIFESPKISATNKCEFLNNIFAGKIHDDLLGFLYLVIAKNRESFLVPALTAFIRIGERYKRNTTAIVVSAVELDEKKISALKDVLSRKTKKNVEIISKLDSSVIGGISIYMDGYCIDRTVKKQLCDMKSSVKKENT